MFVLSKKTLSLKFVDHFVIAEEQQNKKMIILVGLVKVSRLKSRKKGIEPTINLVDSNLHR